jgi:hypothetical protein
MQNMFHKLILTAFFATSLSSVAMAQNTDVKNDVPTLIVTNKPIAKVTPTVNMPPRMPVNSSTSLANNSEAMGRMQDMNNSIYTKPVQSQAITAENVLGTNYFSPFDTMTAKQIDTIQQRLYDLQAEIADKGTELQALQTVGQDLAANYYASVATINTQLQTGTTPGNPRLKARLDVAEDALDTLSGNVVDLNKLSLELADLATVSSFLQQESRAAYGLSGSVEEDHVRLSQLEDSVANTAVGIERLLNTVNDDITRAAAYMSSERDNLRILALAISNGDLYGKSLASRPFLSAADTNISNLASFSAPQPITANGRQLAMLTGQEMNTQTLQQPRPLMKIRFDRPGVDYSQALYMSINDAMKKYPNSMFELVAVSPGLGNPAKLAIEGTKARRNAEKILRNMVQMGVDTNRVDLANLTKDDIQHNEVHLYIR